jgi:tetratricopeptide (TPR) repeat protein
MSTLLAARGLLADSSPQHPTSPSLATSMAQRAAADIVVWGAVYRQRDSLIFRVQITDVSRHRRFPAIDPITVQIDDAIGGAHQLREKVAGALASTFDQRIASVSAPSSRPPSFAAYQEYVIGLEEFAMRDQMRALPHFEAASRLDPDFAAPLIWAAFAYGNWGQTTKKDSVIGLLAMRRERLTPLDRHALEFFLAGQRGDRRAQYEAAKTAARLSPGSQWSHNAGNIAMERHRPAEALAYLLTIDPEHGWARTFPPYWQNLTNALHLLGRYKEELRAAQRLETLHGEGPTPRANVARPLIGLGRAVEAERVAEALLLLPRQAHTPGAEVYFIAQELRTHGYTDLSDRLMDRTLAWYRAGYAASSDGTEPGAAEWRMIIKRTMGRMLYDAGRYAEMQEIDSSMAAQDSTETGATGYLALLAAHRHDRTEAERTMRMLASPFGTEHKPFRGTGYMSAQIAAALGERDQAVALLREVMETNASIGLVMLLHREAVWSDMREYPPFQRLIHTGQ